MPAPLAPLTTAQQQLAVDNRALSYWVLMRYFRRYARQSVIWDELKSSAVRGMIDAARRYDPAYRSPHRPNEQVKFVTFATDTIWGTINRRVERFLLAPPRFRTPISSSRLSLSHILRDSSAPPIAIAARAELRGLVHDFLRFLSPDDALIMRHKFGLDGAAELTHDQIAELVGVSRPRVGQRIANIIEKLRKTHWSRLLTMQRAVA